MKIGILIDRLNIGGVEKIALEEVKALRALGEDAYLLVLRKKGVVNDAFPELQKLVPIIFLDQRLPRLLRLSIRFPIFHFFSSFHITYPLLIPFFIQKREFDYLIVHGTYTAFTAITIKWLRKISFSTFIWDPISYIIERVYSHKFFYFLKILLVNLSKLLDKVIIDNSDYILTGGPAHNTTFTNLNSNIKIVEIPPGVYSLEKISKQKKDYILLMTAWKKGKNPEYIFKLLRIIPQLKVKMVGKWLDKKYMDWFNSEIERKGFTKNISIIGEVSEVQLNNCYQRAIALLQINDDRGFGIPALEAAANGTTFVIPQGQGVCKLFTKNKDGFFVKEMNTKQIVKAINLLYQSKTLMYHMGESAWRKTNKLFSWSQHSIKLMNIINQTNVVRR